MLAALIAYFFLSGGGSGPMDYLESANDRLGDAIVEEAKRDQAEIILGNMLDRTKARDKVNADLAKELADLVDKKSEPESLDAVWERFFEEDAAYSEEILDMRFALRDSVSREEWQALFNPPQPSNN